MEGYSINSSIHKSVASKGTTRRTSKTMDPAEESGWTAYFEDLSSNNDHHHRQKSYSSGFSCSSSLISDAATTAAAWKISHNNHHVFACSSSCAALSSKIPKKLKLKETRTKEICTEDDSLEDTASSPVSNPKVSDWKPTDHMNPRKREDQVRCSLGKDTASEIYSEIQIEEENKMKFDHDQMKNDCTELKKRGMRLVPLSMLVNYLG
ncbi:hypothetical protein DITRI_Ditri12bG0020900 [Diplodiscus trichospermus]